MTRAGWIGFVLGILALALFFALPPIAPITADGMKIVGIVLFTIIWWATTPVPMPVTSILCVSLVVLSGALARDEAFSNLGNYIVWFLIGVYGLAKALELSGFIKRLSLWLLTRRFVKGHPWMLVTAMMLMAAIISSLITQLPAYILMVTLFVGILEQLGYKKGDWVAAALMMGMCWSVEFGSMMLPFSSPMSILVIDWIARDVGYTITFLEWMLAAVPLSLLGLLLVLLVVRLMRSNIKGFAARSGDYLLPEYQKLGSLKREEKIAVGIYLMVVVMWMLSSLTSFLPGGVGSFLTKNVGVALPPLLGAGLLTMIHQRGKPALSWGEWSKAVDWSTVFFLAAIFVIGGVVGDPRFGIDAAMQTILLPMTQEMPVSLFVLFVVAWVVIQTNFMSNLVSLYVVYAAMLPIAVAIGGVDSAALGFLIRFGATMAFAFPSGTVVTAMVTNQGWVTMKQLALYGSILIGLTILLLSFAAYYWAAFIF